jgi:hypothetical protein
MPPIIPPLAISLLNLQRQNLANLNLCTPTSIPSNLQPAGVVSPSPVSQLFGLNVEFEGRCAAGVEESARVMLCLCEEAACAVLAQAEV